MKNVLIVGYGNPLRGDDGVGIAAVEMLRDLGAHSASVRFKALHQLTPELAADLAEVDLAIFIDAACDNVQGEVVHRKVVPARSSPDAFSHHLTPEVLLGLTERLYGTCPEAILFSVGAASFEYGEGLSEPVRAALPALIEEVRAAYAATQS